MSRIIVIGVLVVIVLLLIAQFAPSLVRGETVRLAPPSFGMESDRGPREVGLDELRNVLGNGVDFAKAGAG